MSNIWLTLKAVLSALFGIRRAKDARAAQHLRPKLIIIIAILCAVILVLGLTGLVHLIAHQAT